MEENHEDRLTASQLAAEIVCAYVAQNPISIEELGHLIDMVQSRFNGGNGASTGGANVAPRRGEPAVPVKKSVTPEHIVCLECGKKARTLKRHLMTAHGLTKEAYRARWELPRDYPMVSPAYASVRSEMAKTIGLGVKRRNNAEAVDTAA